jgi:hypothetical protein
MKLTILLILGGVIGTAMVLEGCGEAAPTKAPPITGKARKKWKDMSSDEKIAVLEKSPAPNKGKLEQLVREGKY